MNPEQRHPDEPGETTPPPERPRPEYGEYAPESAPPEAADAGSPTEAPAAAATPSTHSPTVDGVPHNLGIGSAATPANGQALTAATPAGPASPPSSPTDAPRSDAPTAGSPATGAPTAGPPPGRSDLHHGHQQPVQQQPLQQQPVQFHQPQGQEPPSTATGGRLADRIVTIVLLVLGAFSALNLGTALMTLGTQLHTFARIAGIENFRVPEGLGVVQNVGAITILTIYAITLLWSIQRMRARKMAFWVPLAAGALAFIATMIFSFIAIMMVPDLITSLDPDQLIQILQEQTGVGTN